MAEQEHTDARTTIFAQALDHMFHEQRRWPLLQRAGLGAPIAHFRTQEELMSRLMSLAAGLLFAVTTPTNAQSTLPKELPVNSAVTIHGCVAQIQRDGSLSPKTGATATPETVSQESNNPNPTGFYQLLDARPADAKNTKPTTYPLTGHEAEFAKLEGQRVEVAGSVAPAVGDVRSGKMAGAADGAQRIRVSSVKQIEGRCSAAKK